MGREGGHAISGLHCCRGWGGVSFSSTYAGLRGGVCMWVALQTPLQGSPSLRKVKYSDQKLLVSCDFSKSKARGALQRHSQGFLPLPQRPAQTEVSEPLSVPGSSTILGIVSLPSPRPCKDVVFPKLPRRSLRTTGLGNIQDPFLQGWGKVDCG